MSSEISQTIIPNIKVSGISNLNSSLTININENRIRQSSSNLLSQFSLYDVANIKSSAAALLFDYANISINPSAEKSGIINQYSSFNIDTTASSVKLATINLDSTFTLFEYAVVPTFQYVYKIKPETREHKILAETRIYKIRK